jgi:Predicted membrane protein (DUF2207)
MIGLWRIAVLVAALTVARSAVADEVIHTFNSDVQVAEDGELTVTETLRVRAEGNLMRHGIYRDFPLTFRDAGGKVREVTFSVIRVFRDGFSEPYHTERDNGVIRIYAGDKDVSLATGEHTYVFEYRTGRQVRWFDGKPELNWNVTGNFWRFPIETATYTLHLVDGAAPLRWTAFTGVSGARGTDWHGAISSDGTLTVSTTRRLSPGEGLTVVAALAATAVDPPSASTLLWYEFFDYRQWIIGGIGFLVILIYYFAAWEAFGRDPAGGAIIPLFHPPDGISPALANYIHRWGLTREKWRAFTAAALSLAVRGVIVVDRSGGGLTLKTTGNSPDGATPLPVEERAILTTVTIAGGSIVIDRAYAKIVADLADKFTTAVVTANRNRFFRRNLGYVVFGVVMTVAVVAVIANFGGLQDTDYAILYVLGFSGLFFGMFVLPILRSFFGEGPKLETMAGLLIFLAIAVIFVSIIFNIVSAASIRRMSEILPGLRAFVEAYPFSFVLVAAFGALNGIFLYLMKAPTVLGRKVMDQLDGLRLYLETAESDRLNLNAAAPEITKDRFEALLPYAVALDVEKPWAHAFEAALRRANPGDADPMGHYRPGWYGGGNWSSGNFDSAMASTVGGVSGAFAAAVPASSGSSGFSGGGGGGSGGGGGGGGGGGW